MTLHRDKETSVSPSHWPRAAQEMEAVTSQVSLDEADVISQAKLYKGGCRCEELAANDYSSWRMDASAQ